MIFNFLILMVALAIIFSAAVLLVPYRIISDISLKEDKVFYTSLSLAWLWNGLKLNVLLLDKELLEWSIHLVNLRIYSYHADQERHPGEPEEDFEHSIRQSRAGKLMDSVLKFRNRASETVDRTRKFHGKLLKYDRLIRAVPGYISRTLKHLYQSFSINAFKLNICVPEISFYHSGLINGAFVFLKGIINKNLDLNLSGCYSDNERPVFKSKIDVSIHLYVLVYALGWLITRSELLKTGYRIYKERKINRHERGKN